MGKYTCNKVCCVVWCHTVGPIYWEMQWGVTKKLVGALVTTTAAAVVDGYCCTFFCEHPLLLSSSNYMLSPNWLCFCLSHWMTAFLWHTSYADFFTHTLSLFSQPYVCKFNGLFGKKIIFIFFKGKKPCTPSFCLCIFALFKTNNGSSITEKRDSNPTGWITFPKTRRAFPFVSKLRGEEKNRLEKRCRKRTKTGVNIRQHPNHL